MFLSRLTFNTRSSLARRHLAQPYELHRTLLKGFPEGGVHMPRSDPEAHGVLYRVEKHPVLQSPYALVQSVREPDWSLLTAMRDDGHQPFLLTPPECRPFSPDVEAGKIYAFRLRANPTKRLSATRKRVGFYREEDQLLWLYRRLRSLDFFAEDEQPAAVHILQAFVSKEGDITDRVHQHDITLTSIQFNGFLEIIDPASVLTLIRNGVGSAKGFGFGLLSLRRAG